MALLSARARPGLKGHIELRCLGGFVLTQHYGIGRQTSDIDVLTVASSSGGDDLEALAGRGSALHRKHRVYLQYVGVLTPPSEYTERLVRTFAATSWKHRST